QLDVAHALAADAAVRDLDAAAVAHHALVLHAAVLAAGALPVLLRPEDALAEEAVLLRAVGAVVDGLRLLDLAERPRADVGRAGQADPHRAVVVDPVVVDLAGAHARLSFCIRTPRGAAARGDHRRTVFDRPRL